MNAAPTSWMRFLPARIRRRFEHRPNLQSAVTNTGWLFSDRILRMTVGLLVGVWVARYLGPKQFGLISYSLAFVSLFGAVATMGLNAIVVQDLVREPEATDVTLGTTFVLHVIGGLLACALAIVSIRYARPNDTMAKMMVAVFGFMMVFKSGDVVKYWFESQVLSKYTVWVENGTFLIFAVIKWVLILSNASVMAFVWATFFEMGVVAIGLLVLYSRRVGKVYAWRIHFGTARKLLARSWPLMLSGLAVILYMRVDQIMIGQMLGDGAVGIYSAAVRVSEVWYFVPAAIVASVFPSIIDAKKRDEMLYSSRVQRLSRLIMRLSLVPALFVVFLADWIIVFLFGQSYAEAANVLTIHIWTGVFVGLGIANGQWYVIEGRQRYSLTITLMAGVQNVILNALLIPPYGIGGAAAATLISYGISTMILPFIFVETRPLGMFNLRSIR